MPDSTLISAYLNFCAHLRVFAFVVSDFVGLFLLLCLSLLNGTERPLMR